MIGTYVMYALFFGLSAFMLYALTQYGKPVEIEFGPVTFGGGTRIFPPPSMAIEELAESVDYPRVYRHGSVTIRAAAGARVIIG